jgi:negative regulator of sigma E activity
LSHSAQLPQRGTGGLILLAAVVGVQQRFSGNQANPRWADTTLFNGTTSQAQTVPLEGCCKPHNAGNNVILPAPFCPSNAVIDPGSM